MFLIVEHHCVVSGTAKNGNKLSLDCQLRFQSYFGSEQRNSPFQVHQMVVHFSNKLKTSYQERQIGPLLRQKK